MSMSLDGYVADLNDGVAEVFDWYFTSGDVEIHTGGSDPMTFKVSGPSAEHLRGLTSELGAMLTGRRTFDVAQGWGGNHAWGPAFVLTHHVPAGWPRPNSTVHFVIDGIESAVNQAKAAAAGKSVGVHGANTIQQCLNAGLLNEIHVDIAAVLLGSGVRLFDHLAGTPAVLGNPTVIPGVTCKVKFTPPDEARSASFPKEDDVDHLDQPMIFPGAAAVAQLVAMGVPAPAFDISQFEPGNPQLCQRFDFL
jgi:dihydrofolate reductase